MLLPSMFQGRSPIERAFLLRYLAFCLSVALAYFQRQQLAVADSFLFTAALATLLNVGASALSTWSRFAGFARGLSFVFGILSWCAMAALSGGADSPFILGLGLEVLLSGLLGSARATGLVSAVAIAGLWGQQLVIGALMLPSIPKLLLLTVLLLFMGVLASFAASRWRLQGDEFALRSRVLTQRVRNLEQEMECLRPLSRCGEDSARIAHSLKNAVSNLRGYCQVLEQRTEYSETDRRALQGLRRAVDQIERNALATLHPLRQDSGDPVSGGEVVKAIREALAEVAACHPEMRWDQAGSKEIPGVHVPYSVLREVLPVLAQNAAEATDGRGLVTLVSWAEQGALRIDISDNGPGIAPEIRERLFLPGVTTKGSGTGLGLFLARRLVEFYGGSLVAASSGGRGTTFTLKLPAKNM
jgi:two-component system, NtrC family, sensor histidine kinase HydH